MNLYLLDAGIKEIKLEKRDLENIKIYQCSFEMLQNQKIIFNKIDKICSNIHGQIVCETIIYFKNYIKPINLISIRILNNYLKSNFSILINALKFIYNSYNKSNSLINLSLGIISENFTEQHISELHNLITSLLSRKIYIVCAASKVISYPSVFEEVISVSDMNMYINDRKEIKHKIDFVVDIDLNKYPFIPCSATSFAAPFVTAKAAEILQTKKIDNIFQLKEELAKYFMRWEQPL